MNELIAYLEGRIRCLELQGAVISGLHEAWSVSPPGSGRKEISRLIGHRLDLVASVSDEIADAARDAIAGGIQIDVPTGLEILSGVRGRITVCIPGGRRPEGRQRSVGRQVRSHERQGIRHKKGGLSHGEQPSRLGDRRVCEIRPLGRRRPAAH